MKSTICFLQVYLETSNLEKKLFDFLRLSISRRVGVQSTKGQEARVDESDDDQRPALDAFVDEQSEISYLKNFKKKNWKVTIFKIAFK